MKKSVMVRLEIFGDFGGYFGEIKFEKVLSGEGDVTVQST